MLQNFWNRSHARFAVSKCGLVALQRYHPSSAISPLASTVCALRNPKPFSFALAMKGVVDAGWSCDSGDPYYFEARSFWCLHCILDTKTNCWIGDSIEDTCADLPIRVGITSSAGRGVFATRDIDHGELIHTAEPVVAHPSLTSLHKVLLRALWYDGMLQLVIWWHDSASSLMRRGPMQVCYFCLKGLKRAVSYTRSSVPAPASDGSPIFCSSTCDESAQVCESLWVRKYKLSTNLMNLQLRNLLIFNARWFVSNKTRAFIKVSTICTSQEVGKVELQWGILSGMQVFYAIEQQADWSEFHDYCRWGLKYFMVFENYPIWFTRDYLVGQLI